MDLEDSNYIPSKKGLLEGTVLSLNEALSRIAQVDFQGISNELKMTLETFRSTLDDPAVDNIMKEVSLTVKELRSVVSSVNSKLKSLEISNIITNLNKALENIQSLAATMNSEIKGLQLSKLSAAADKTLQSTSNTVKQFQTSIASIEKEFNVTLKDIRALTNESAKIRTDLNKVSDSLTKGSMQVKTSLMTTLDKLDKTLMTITAFFEMIENDPSSLIQGKSK
jgi:septation ring formation regulator EzrA